MKQLCQPRTIVKAGVVAGLTIALTLSGLTSASADIVIDGPVDLGTAASYGVLGATTVTNTGPTVVNGDVGLSPGTSVTGFDGPPDGTINGTLQQTNAAAGQAQTDTTTAYDVAASLTPTRSGLTDLAGLSLSPGVYSGGDLSLSDNGILTLEGSARSVWVFQAASTLIIGSATSIVMTGGANSCNVFWQVGSSATLGTGAQFQGTVMARQSITANTAATVEGRLLARAGAVTLDTNTITASSNCPAPGTVSESPEFTSPVPAEATVGTSYSHTVTASGSPTPMLRISSGSLPAGLSFDTATGRISGTPTAAGTSSFTITASNGTGPDATVTYTITTRPSSNRALAATGTDAAPFVLSGSLVTLAGLALVLTAARRRRVDAARN